MLPEEQALPLMSKYDVSYALVFTPDDSQKFNWIAEIAGYNASEYLTVEDDVYQPTVIGSHVMLLRLLFDDISAPTHKCPNWVSLNKLRSKQPILRRIVY